MPKKVYIIESDDYETMQSLIKTILADLDRAETCSHYRLEAIRHSEELREIMERGEN